MVKKLDLGWQTPFLYTRVWAVFVATHVHYDSVIVVNAQRFTRSSRGALIAFILSYAHCLQGDL